MVVLAAQWVYALNGEDGAFGVQQHQQQGRCKVKANVVIPKVQLRNSIIVGCNVYARILMVERICIGVV
jgi:hypothetical protein